MFSKRIEPQPAPQEPATVSPAPVPELPAQRPAPAPASARPSAVIGPTICIRGEVTGDEDVLVEGRVEGDLNLPQNQVQVGKGGRVQAKVNARLVEVEGAIEGDISGNEKVVLRQSAEVSGNIRSPRVTLEDGCRFKGSIDMDPGAAEAPVSGIALASGPAKSTSSGG